MSPDELVAEFQAELPFALDDFQLEAIRALANRHSVLVAAPTGTGKALASDTPVVTPTGLRRIDSLRLGDQVIGADGQPTTVLGVYPQGTRPGYRVTFSDGVSVVCDLEHLWAVNTKSRRHARLAWRVLTLRQILDEGLSDGQGRRHFVPMVRPVAFAGERPAPALSSLAARRNAGVTQRGLAAHLGVSQSYVAYRETGRRALTPEWEAAVRGALAERGTRAPLHPYLLGLLLGDGGLSTGSVRFSSADSELVEAVEALAPAGVALIRGSRPYDWQVVSRKRRAWNPVMDELRAAGLLGRRAESKFVPEVYKFAAPADRLAVLQGLFDTDGSVDRRGLVEFTTVSPRLAADVAFLVRSLGGRASIRLKPTRCQPAYRLFVHLPEGLSPFTLTRKRARYQAHARRQPCRAIAKVEPIGDVEMTCIAVDAPDGLFVVDGFVVTHNTVVGEFGIFMARKYAAGAIYTTPIKALSNQKFRDFRARWGDDEVGLLTGDVVVNREAPVRVMTTEVLRNMLVTGAALADVGAIVFDEVHYMGDPERGTAWEEAILMAPREVPLVCLSATVPNAHEIAEWIREAHGELSCVFHDQRAVPLEHRYWLPAPPQPPTGEAHRRRPALAAAGPRKEPGTTAETGFSVLTVLDAADQVTPQAKRLRNVGGELAGRVRWGGATSQGFRGEDLDEGDREPREAPEPWRVIRFLEQQELTPAIYFLFSRRATEEAASSCLALRPVPHAMDLIREAKGRLADLPSEDRNLRQVAMLLGRFLPRGVAVHHAGLLPQVKLLVEELFQAGKLRAVFATDTLALGINMPARTVVVGEMVKFDGQSRRLLTPNEYRQMTGRAGRRGLDARGVSLIQYSPWVSFAQTLRVISGDLLPLESAFRPTYSTAMNLWLRPEDEERLADLYARSLRRFQHDRGLKELTERKQTLEDAYERERATADLARREIWERANELSRVDYELRRARRAATVEARRTVEGLARVLERYGYLRDGRPTDKAPYLRGLFDTNALTLGELLTNRQLEGLEPAELADALSWFAMDRESPMRGLPLTRRLHRLREILDVLHGGVLREEERQGLQISRPLPVDFHGLALAWADGHDLSSIAQRAHIQEGDLVGALQKTLDLLGQLRGAAQRGPLGAGLVPALDAADHLLRRGVVEAGYRWAVGGVPEPDPAEAEGLMAWDVPLVEDEEPPERLGRPRWDRRGRGGGPRGGPRKERGYLRAVPSSPPNRQARRRRGGRG